MVDYKSLEPGKYTGLLKNWKIDVNPRLNTPEVTLTFEFGAGGETTEMPFRGLWFKKNGGVNKKTADTLKIVGFQGEDPRKLNTTNLDTAPEYQLDLARNDKGFIFIDWVSRSDGSPEPKATASKSLDDFFPGAPPEDDIGF